MLFYRFAAAQPAQIAPAVVDGPEDAASEDEDGEGADEDGDGTLLHDAASLKVWPV